MLTMLLSYHITSMFVNTQAPAHAIATQGLPLFALGFIPFAINMVIVGYFQSVERMKEAFGITMLSGGLLMVPAFLLLPQLWGDAGVWLAVPATELVTALIAVVLVRR